MGRKNAAVDFHVYDWVFCFLYRNSAYDVEFFSVRRSHEGGDCTVVLKMGILT